MALRIRRKQPQEEDFQMAPMIDMVFLLLVFFMCVSTLAQAEKKTVALPESTASQVAEDLDNRGILSIDATGNLYMGALPVDLATMRTRLKAALQENPALKIQIRADAATQFSKIKAVLKACAEEGAYNVIYSTEQSR